MNSPLEEVFRGDCQSLRIPGENGFVVMYHGYIAEHNGLETALEAISRIRKEVQHLKFEIYGFGNLAYIQKLLRRVEELGLTDIVDYHGYQSQSVIAQAIQSISVGVIPNKMTPFTNLNLPTRIFEYLAMKKPVIAPHTKGIMDYFNEESLHLFEAGNVDSLAGVILDVCRNPSRRQSTLERGIEIYNKHRWGAEKRHLVELVKNM